MRRKVCSHCLFTLEWLGYLNCVLSLSLIVAYFIFSIIWHVDVSCYVPLRTWLSRQVCALMISAGALAKAMTCALFFEMLLLDRRLLRSTKFLSLYSSFLFKLVGSRFFLRPTIVYMTNSKLLLYRIYLCG
ncbi:hypothetical protein M6B38_223965 [Iris pallida]|uniref:Uncharacterized protein n=1 Tax=Iris pallida TaxID=29817 RepID=A0AAX6DVV1_IRIPA|nr:hypothetical protein M6B38_223965 [Iris pallida]